MVSHRSEPERKKKSEKSGKEPKRKRSRRSNSNSSVDRSNPLEDGEILDGVDLNSLMRRQERLAAALSCTSDQASSGTLKPLVRAAHSDRRDRSSPQRHQREDRHAKSQR